MAAAFEVYEDSARKWRWRMWSTGNWEIVSVSSESYETKYGAERSVQWVKDNAGPAPITGSS
jgi:uncharacterized protein YegP (UPF0339 family)